MLMPADYRDAWDLILNWRDNRDQQTIIEHVADRDRLPFVTIALIKLVAALARTTLAEEGFTKRLAELNHFNVLPAVLGLAHQILASVELEFDPTKEGAEALFNRIPDTYGFRDYLSDTTGFDDIDADE